MPDVTTTCPQCGATFETKRGLATHRTMAGHYDTVDAGIFATQARAISCLFPGCGSAFRSRFGLRIHSTLLGHHAPADRLAKGDGELPAPTVHRGPRQPKPEPEVETDAETNPFGFEGLGAGYPREYPGPLDPDEGLHAMARRVKALQGASEVMAMMPTDRSDATMLANALAATIDAALAAAMAGSTDTAVALLLAADNVCDSLCQALAPQDLAEPGPESDFYTATA